MMAERGYSLVEMMVATAITLVVTGTTLALVGPSHGLSQAQPEASDMQQNARVAMEALSRDLTAAGAGPDDGAATAALVRFLAPILPHRAGRLHDDARVGVFYRPDAICLLSVPTASPHTTVRSPMAHESADIDVNPSPNCPADDALCGFREGLRVLIFDDTGTHDVFEITGVGASAMQLQHGAQRLQKSYDAGSHLVGIDLHTYYLDVASNRLRHYDGLDTDLPLVDNVVDLRFSYFGDPQPPLAPKPAPGTANCVFDAAGNPLLPALSGGGGSLVPLDPPMLQDGPWCGAGSSLFDADLLRIRAVRVAVRTQAASPALRGTHPVLFRRPGTARGGARFIPDLQIVLDVSPRNLNFAR